METIKWGIIGCGDVTEVKSGPAFNKAERSSLVAVMRRDALRAADYARRHRVPQWYDDADKLIHDPEINAIYIATPPSSHEHYTIEALKAGKAVYVEKPMALNAQQCLRMQEYAHAYNGKLTVAHYRRALPVFNKVKSLIDDKAIGEIRFVDLKMFQPVKPKLVAQSESNWRLNPEISGGGLFHDLAPHQLDLMRYYFGNVKYASGTSLNRAGLYAADDLVSGRILFENGVLFQGLWCFSVDEHSAVDECRIEGSKGSITFPVFGNHVTLNQQGTTTKFNFERPAHVQQPMIERVVKYFLNEGPNPCIAAEGTEVMRIIDSFNTNS